MQSASALLLYLRKFVMFKFQPVTHVNAIGQQCNGNLGNNTGIVIFDIGIVTANIDHSTEHGVLLCETAPVTRGGS